MKIYTLHRKQVFDQPIDEIFPFFESPENLGTITPSWLHFRFVTPLPIEMKEGAIIEYTISWLGIPIRWKTLISRYDPPREFADFQVKGPYALWDHTHSFRQTDGGTEMTDTIRYALPFGLIGRIAHRLAIRKQIRKIFDHRAEILRRRFNRKHAAAVPAS